MVDISYGIDRVGRGRKPMLTDKQGHILSVDGNADVFGRQSVASPDTEGEYVFTYNLLPIEVDVITSGTATCVYEEYDGTAKLDVAANNDVAIIGTRKYHRYQPGKAQIIRWTTVFGSTDANVIKRVGYFDDKNGLFFFQSGSSVGVCLRSETTVSGTVTDTLTFQEDWNVDIVDGSDNSVSGLNLDTTKDNIFEIQFQWLGAGITKFFVFGEENEKILVHQINNSNVNSTSYMRTGSLPFRGEVEAIGAITSNDPMKIPCISVTSNGGDRYTEYSFSYQTGEVSTSDANETHLVSYRLKSTFGTGNQDTRGVAYKHKIGVYVASNPARIRAYISQASGVLGGAVTWTAVDSVHSMMEVNTAGTFTSGVSTHKILDYTVPAANNIETIVSSDFLSQILSRSHKNDDADSDILTITSTRLGANNTDVTPSYTWSEVH